MQVKIVFFGSDDFALTNLEKLVASEHEVLACVTPSDKAKGRGLKVAASPIKEYALKGKIPFYQPDDLKDPRLLKELKEFRCDLFVVVAYGKILPIELLSIPYVCAMNVHASLLPKYRGAAPIHWALLNGEKETGVSVIKMNAQLDAGDIFAQAKVDIEENENAPSLRRRLAALGAELLLKTINSLEKNDYTLTAQDSRRVTLAPKLTKALGSIDWNKPVRVIHNQVRGLLPWPAAFSYYRGKLVKVVESQLVAGSSIPAEPGMIIEIRSEGLIVSTGEGGLLVKRVHPEAGREMDAKSFAVGYHMKAGDMLGPG